MINLEKYILVSQYDTLEKMILQDLERKNSVEMLFITSLFYLKCPNLKEEKSISYLNEICKREPYNFDAIIIKLYNLSYHFGEKDESFDILITHNWNDIIKESIVYYVKSWYEERIDEKEKLLKKSIELNSVFPNAYKKLGDIYSNKNKLEYAKECYINSINNVISTTFPKDAEYREDIFIEEYILGTRQSDLNYEILEERIAKIST
jgi:tetratricopeptide (TPR) repeat protein